AKDLGVPLTSFEERASVDLAVDGADEVDPKLDLIKGLGGALFREKIVAAAAQQFVVIVDESKLVPRLGVRAPVPVEVHPVRRPGTAVALLFQVALFDPAAPPELLRRDADLGLSDARRLLDLDGRRLLPFRSEYERLRDVPRKAGLDEQVHQGFVPATQADFPARRIPPPFINLAIYISSDGRGLGRYESESDRSRDRPGIPFFG